MNSRIVKNLLMVTALAPALGGIAFVGCDDSDTDNKVKDGGVDAPGPGDTGTLPPVGDGGGDAPVVGCVPNTPVPSEINKDTVWNCPSYLLGKMTYVTNNATLTIMPGVTITADTAAAPPRAGLIISRGSKLIAKGTKESPIVFTSANAVGNRASGDFAGVALLGNARLNSGTCVGGTGACAEPTAFFERNIEGLPPTEPRAKYGGVDDAWSCGEISYVRIEFAGAILSGENELNGLTLGGCGSNTKVSYVQVHRGKDDGVEFFGGTANIDHLLVTGDEDDGLDWDFGWRGKAQYVIIHKWAGLASGDPNGFEGDNNKDKETATPRTAPMIYNATLIGTPGHWGMTLRRGVRGHIRNIIMQGFGVKTADVQWTDPTIVTATEWPAELSVENSFFWMNGPYDTEVAGMASDDDKGFDEAVAFADPARKNQFLINPDITSVAPTAPNYTPKAAGLAGQAVPPAGLDPLGTYAGAVAPNTPSWTEVWTRYPQN